MYTRFSTRIGDRVYQGTVMSPARAAELAAELDEKPRAYDMSANHIDWLPKPPQGPSGN